MVGGQTRAGDDKQSQGQEHPEANHPESRGEMHKAETALSSGLGFDSKAAIASNNRG